MAKVAFIGLGRMGHGMAGRYLDAGFGVAVWNRSKAKAEDLIARGAQWATSPLTPLSTSIGISARSEPARSTS
jgi:3-hydroxyisobutyrate dehydrogenase-like beta-hydroxyacid dehydrogenase